MKQVKLGTFLIGALALLLTIGCGDDTSNSIDASSPVYGTWALSQQVNNAGSMNTDLKIEPGRVTLSAVCQIGADSTEVSVSVKADILDTKIVLKEEDSDSKEINGMRCALQLGQLEWNYVVSGNQLTLTQANGRGQQVLTRK